jgi:hypothetical protein
MPKFTIELDSLDHLLILAPLVDMLTMEKDEGGYDRISQTLTEAGKSFSTLLVFVSILGRRLSLSDLDEVETELWLNNMEELKIFLALFEEDPCKN